MSLTVQQFKTVLRRRVKQAGGVRKLARELGVSHAHISQTLCHDELEPIPSVVHATGYRKRETATVYERL